MFALNGKVCCVNFGRLTSNANLLRNFYEAVGTSLDGVIAKLSENEIICVANFSKTERIRSNLGKRNKIGWD